MPCPPHPTRLAPGRPCRTRLGVPRSGVADRTGPGRWHSGGDASSRCHGPRRAPGHCPAMACRGTRPPARFGARPPGREGRRAPGRERLGCCGRGVLCDPRRARLDRRLCSPPRVGDGAHGRSEVGRPRQPGDAPRPGPQGSTGAAHRRRAGLGRARSRRRTAGHRRGNDLAPPDRRARRDVRSVLPDRGPAVRAWLRRPAGPMRGISCSCHTATGASTRPTRRASAGSDPERRIESPTGRIVAICSPAGR